MKRLLALLLVFATLTALISGCASEKDSLCAHGGCHPYGG